jgi:molybdenum-dependent DNA-binding transcriptional regulator ModE
MRLRSRQLLLLEALGRERNLGRAAAALGMSQPAATKLLQQAEETLGVAVFTRQARGMEPTGVGEVLIRYARQSLVDFGFAASRWRAALRPARAAARGQRAGRCRNCWRRAGGVQEAASAGGGVGAGGNQRRDAGPAGTRRRRPGAGPAHERHFEDELEIRPCWANRRWRWCAPAIRC